MPAPTSSAHTPLSYRALTFLSAFLLFDVQLIAAKAMLPWFGGASSVWTTCVLFFQLVLLLGYGYTHATTRLPPPARFRLHAALLLISLIAMAAGVLRWRAPLLPPAPPLLSTELPTLNVLLFLTLGVGMPFWLLSTTSPLLQDWLARQHDLPPYRLYALSNAGSLAGLLAYPFVLEPLLTLRAQTWMWAAAYAVFVAGTLVIGSAVARSSLGQTAATATAAADLTPQRKAAGTKPRSAGQPAASATTLASTLTWVVLAATGAALMLATTNYITQDVASVPLLWVLPLSLYLLSFILTFSSERLYRARWVYPSLALALAAIAAVEYRGGSFPVKWQIAAASAALLLGTVFCHGELYRRRPAPARLTWFYFMVAVGGAVGSAFVALVAPHLFPDVWEFNIALGAVAVLAAALPVFDRTSWLQRAPAWQIAAAAAVLAIMPIVVGIDLRQDAAPWLQQLHYWLLGIYAAVVLAMFARQMFAERKPRRASRAAPNAGAMPALARLLVLLPPAALITVLWLDTQITWAPVLLRTRSFYGVLTVLEQHAGDPLRDDYELYHGRTLHGLQLRNPKLRLGASTYYTTLSGVGQALNHHARRASSDPAQRALRVGVVGLGTGTLLLYAEPGDYFRIYELNPAVIALSRGANPYFTYLQECRGSTDFVLGDARVSLQGEAGAGHLQQFDVLVVDAFNGEAVPVHLLTREAIELYLRHLRDERSVIALHISNEVLDLAPVVARLASDLGLHAVRITTAPRGLFVKASDWVLLSRSPAPIKLQPEATAHELPPPGPLWTDQFSNLAGIVR